MERKKLTRDEVYKSIKDRNAYVVFSNLKVELSSAQLDGTNTHGSKSLLAAICSAFNLYRNGDFPEKETMAEYRIRNEKIFELSLDKIIEAVNDYHVKI